MRRTPRAGYTMLELVVGGAMLAVAMTVVMQYVATWSHQELLQRDRQRALVEAGNWMERLYAVDADQLTEAALAQWTLSSEFRVAVPEARLRWTVTEEAGPPASKRIEFVIDWPINPAGHRAEERFVVRRCPEVKS